MPDFENKLAAWKALYDEMSAARVKLQRPEELGAGEVERLQLMLATLRERSELALKDLQAYVDRTADGQAGP